MIEAPTGVAPRQPEISNESSAAGRVVVVANLASRAARGAWGGLSAQLRQTTRICGEVETRADGSNVERVTRMLGEERPDLVIALGGDGTVSEVVQGLMQVTVEYRSTLAIIPFGTANDVARALGIESCRTGGDRAVAAAIRTALGGTHRRIDIGKLGTRYFVGALTLGMDADILRTRNRWRAALGSVAIPGYPLYLLSCAVNVLRRHGGPARLSIDGAGCSTAVYNLLVTNTANYAGEFRFDGPNSTDDGYLDLHVFTGPFDYVREFALAWRRHVHFTRGDPVVPLARLRRTRRLLVEFDAPVPCQMDGEQYAPAAAYQVEIVPGALTVRVPGAKA